MISTGGVESVAAAEILMPRKNPFVPQRGPMASEWKKVHRAGTEAGARVYIDSEPWRTALAFARIDPDTPLKNLRVKFCAAHKGKGSRQARIMITVKFVEDCGDE